VDFLANYEMQSLIRLKQIGLIITTTVLISGCVTIRESRIPEFIERLDRFEFSEDQREVIGDVLHYVNELENN